jgi:hypothetical protein
MSKGKVKPFHYYFIPKLNKNIVLFLTFLFSNKCDSTGTKVSVNINAPINANPRVYAKGENILPSTF